MAQVTENASLSVKEPHWAKFERFEKQTGQPPWVFPLRKAGMVRFTELGFPTPQSEDWRFTNVAPIAKLPFKPVLQPTRTVVSRESLATLVFGGLPAARLVFLNGHFVADLSDPGVAAAGVTVTNLSAALAGHAPLIEKHLGRPLNGQDNAFSALNTAFFQDGCFVHVPAGQVVETPIHALFLSTTKETGATISPRNLVLVDRGAQATFIESYLSTSDSAYFTNAMTHLVLDEAAVAEHCKFQGEALTAFHVAGIEAQLGRHSQLVSHSIATGARLSRNNIRTHLAGEGAECVLNGLYLTRGDQLADHHMVVEHAQPGCQSHEYYNGILDGRSKGVFHGRILVRPAAQKTDAKQTNKNLLLSEEATIDTKPQLEIYADDVKCTHGATVGQLNEESIFYLRARGIGAERARRMLIHAFAGEIIDRIRCRPLRTELDRLVWDRLEANPLVRENP